MARAATYEDVVDGKLERKSLDDRVGFYRPRTSRSHPIIGGCRKVGRKALSN